MYNLIVTGGIENDRRASIMASRTFEYTDDELKAMLKPGGSLDGAALTRLPTLLMDEGTGDQPVRLGYLSRIVRNGASYDLQFAMDQDLPRLTNADVYAMAVELGIGEWEFSRNHWAVKDIDLFEILYRRSAGDRPRPTVFELSQNPVEPRLVSMMMPFAGEFSRPHQAIKNALEAEGYECRRADDFWLHPQIMQDIVELICTSRLVICDLSGKNPNVFYEAGIAHALGKDVILITQSAEDVPFDLRSLRYVTYLNNDEGCADLATKVVDRVRTVVMLAR